MIDLTAELPVLAEGDLLAPGYEVVELLSRGSALDVYEVWSRERLCSCVAKTVRPDRVDVSRVRHRLLQEGWLLRELAHPHLARAYETVEGPAAPVVVLETHVGMTLEEMVAELPRRLPLSDLCHLGRQLASALHYLHGRGYVHLDVRPANVMAHAGTATLLDLSIARPPGRVRRGLGTQEYLSPEQGTGGLVSPASDTWGLGVTLHEAATGVRAFAPQDAAERAAFARGDVLQLTRRAPSVAELRPLLPQGFADLVDACLDEDPSRRPSVREVHDRLGEWVGA